MIGRNSAIINLTAVLKIYFIDTFLKIAYQMQKMSLMIAESLHKETQN